MAKKTLMVDVEGVGVKTLSYEEQYGKYFYFVFSNGGGYVYGASKGLYVAEYIGNTYYPTDGISMSDSQKLYLFAGHMGEVTTDGRVIDPVMYPTVYIGAPHTGVTVNISYGVSSIPTLQDCALPITFAYGSSQIPSITSKGGSRTLQCNGMLMDGNVVVRDSNGKSRTLQCNGMLMSSNITVTTS